MIERRRRAAALAIGALLLTGCATIDNPATGRRETVLDTGFEQSIGAIARAQMGLTALTVGQVSNEQLGRVQRIGARLAAVSDRKDLDYQFGVVQEKTLNAFALPGGTIYVHSGLLEKATDEELTAVLAHEVGHVAARHAAKHLQADLGFALLLHVASAAADAGPDSIRVANSVYGLIRNGYSREDELEADRLAIRYTRRAGSPPEGLLSFFEKMLEEHPEGPLAQAASWRSSHPLTSERIEKAKTEIGRLEATDATGKEAG
ncbi:MAG: peptidase M48 Ste24p [Candidatus Omnitrophica bacterium CG11_big_fil_rev_8_21_14_0_20_64_10]|nr:MAG: peptidase M48 Ste24p [Candidatus Omnitrophica bacterium CG11_big_fil_rev_8_21_14_0_20_64_10]